MQESQYHIVEIILQFVSLGVILFAGARWAGSLETKVDNNKESLDNHIEDDNRKHEALEHDVSDLKVKVAVHSSKLRTYLESDGK
jgi:hypothetical protein